MQKEKPKPPGLLDVLLFVLVHYQVEGNLALGICKYTWRDDLLWRSLIEMMHSPIKQDGDIVVTANRLVLASRKGRLDVVQRLLTLGAKIEGKSVNGNTALALACLHGRTSVAIFLLERHADIETRNHIGWTPLLIAARSGDRGVCRALLVKNASVEAASLIGTRAMHLAAQHDKQEVLCLLQQAGAQIEAPTYSLMTPLALACFSGQVESARLLLKFGANVEARESEGWSVLLLAVQSGNGVLVKLLLEEGDANIDLLSYSNRSACWIACYSGNIEALSILIDHGADIDLGDPPIHACALAIDEDDAPLLIDTELLWARRELCVRLLLRHNVVTNVLDAQGLLPGAVALQNGHPEIFQVMLSLV